MQRYLTTPEAAAELGISQQRVRQLIAAGRLRSDRIGRDHAIPESALAAVRERKPGRPWPAREASKGKANGKRMKH